MLELSSAVSSRASNESYANVRYHGEGLPSSLSSGSTITRDPGLEPKLWLIRDP